MGGGIQKNLRSSVPEELLMCDCVAMIHSTSGFLMLVMVGFWFSARA